MLNNSDDDDDDDNNNNNNNNNHFTQPSPPLIAKLKGRGQLPP